MRYIVGKLNSQVHFKYETTYRNKGNIIVDLVRDFGEDVIGKKGSVSKDWAEDWNVF